jgi:muramoyltetrapeptide carboxypeptidase
MRKPRALRPGDRIALVAPASGFSRNDLESGVAELRRIGFDPVYDERIFERHHYLAGDAATRAEVFRSAWRDPDVAALIAVRGGYGSTHLLPLLDRAEIARTPKAFVGYSDTTALLTWLTLHAGVVAYHGPMLEARFARGEQAYDRDSFTRVLMRPEPAGSLAPGTLDVVTAGEAAGMLVGGTLTQLVASLGTPFAFNPPDGHILFIDEVGERPYRLDRMLTQLAQAGILRRTAGIVFNELPRCDEPGDAMPTARTIVADVLRDFQGPILYGFPSGHTNGASVTLPFGVGARLVTTGGPALIIEEAAVEAPA